MRGSCVEVIATATWRASAHGACAGPCCRAFCASTEHAEISGHNFEAGALLSFFILPLSRLNPPFDENQRTFLQILLCNLRLFAPDNNLVPLRALLALAIAVFVGFIRGYGKIGDRLASAGVAGLRIAAQPAPQNHFIDRHTFPLEVRTIAEKIAKRVVAFAPMLLGCETTWRRERQTGFGLDRRRQISTGRIRRWAGRCRVHPPGPCAQGESHWWLRLPGMRIYSGCRCGKQAPPWRSEN